MNDANVSVVGNVATEVRSRVTKNGHHVASFRLACNARRYDRQTQTWVDGETSFYRVVCWRTLAENVATCVKRGDPIVVQGKLKLKDWTDDAGAARTDAEIDASSVGHDLRRGKSEFTRIRRTSAAPSEGEALEVVRSEQLTRADDDVLTDPGTGTMYRLDELRRKRLGSDAKGDAIQVAA